MSDKTIIRIAILLLFFVRVVLAQELVPSYSPENLLRQVRTLQQNMENAESAKSDGLGELALQARDLGKQLQVSRDTLQGCNAIGTAHFHIDGAHDGGYLRLQCGGDLNLIITMSSGDGWERVQTLVIPNKYEEATVDARAVTGDKSDQLLIHKAQYLSGTGVSQRNFLVYRFNGQKMHPVLNAVESGYVSDPWTKHEVSQRSRFTFEHEKDSTPNFEEVQMVEFAGMKIELKREHTWSKDSQTFVATQWYSGRRLITRESKATQR